MVCPHAQLVLTHRQTTSGTLARLRDVLEVDEPDLFEWQVSVSVTGRPLLEQRMLGAVDQPAFVAECQSEDFARGFSAGQIGSAKRPGGAANTL